MPSERFETAANTSLSLDMLPPPPDLNFIADNLLTPDDFNLGINFEVEVDPNEFLFGSDDEIFQHITDDLEIPMTLDENGINLPRFSHHENIINCLPVNELSNSTVNKCIIKQEPFSPRHSPPSPHGSDSSIDAWQLLSSEAPNELRLLETPPITPQSSLDGSPPSTPTNGELSNTVQVVLQSIPTLHTSTPISLMHPSRSRTRSKRIMPAIDKIQSKKAAPSQVVVLTPNEYSNFNPADANVTISNSSEISITSNCIKNEGNSNGINPMAKIITSAPTSTLKPLMSLPSLNVKQEIDVNAFKRQQRMIKNRESACLSRKKKKEYMASLENEVKDLAAVNTRLQQENCHLKQIVNKLEKENLDLKKRFNLSNVKKTTAVLAVLFMLSLNVGPVREMFTSKQSFPQPINPSAGHHHSRSLLWSESLADNETKETSSWEVKEANGSRDVVTDGLLDQTSNNSSYKAKCPMYINKTESQRLESELRGWVFRSEKNPGRKVPYETRKKSVPPIPRLQSLIIPEMNVKPKDFRFEVNLIERRNDTFYVISLTKDQVLWSARTHNKSGPPLMSLVLPTNPFTENDNRSQKDHVTMMQIDCEVTNTKLVHIKESLIRHHKSEGKNQTSFYESSDDENDVGGNETPNLKRKRKNEAREKQKLSTG